MEKNRLVEHIAKFVSGLWQIHPFGEGNTRTTAIFTIKYLRSLGFDVNNDLFEQHSWYFRNALVRANYRNVAKGIDYEPVFLVRFFRNLLLGEENTLKNRYMIIDPPEEWKMPETEQIPDNLPDKSPDKLPDNLPDKLPDNLPDKLPDKLLPKNMKIISLLMVIGLKEMSIKEMLEHLGLKNRESFMEVYLNPALKEKFVRMRYPDKPNHPRQKYLLTTKGTVLYNEIISSH